jgi:hypothetical protein
MTGTGQHPTEPAPAGLAEVRRALAAVRGRKRVDVLLDQPDPAAIVRALPADELFHAIQEVGLADAAEVVQLASPEQFRTFVDLDAWRAGEPAVERMLPWIRAARGSSASDDDELDAWREKLDRLDPELVSLLLRSSLRIHDLEEDEDPEIEGDRFVRTTEGRYIVEFLPEGADYVVVRALVDDLYARDPFRAGRVLSAVRWELDSELAETALRWRDGRLSDLGYPTLEEALSWFAKPASRIEVQAGLPDRPAGFWLASHRHDTLLDRAAARLDPDALARFEGQAVTAANAALVADRVDPADPDAVRGAVETARAFLEMGLEALSGGDADAAAAVLAGTPLKRVFQRGFGEVLALRWKAERDRKAFGAGPVPALDPPLGEAEAALLRRRPLYFPGLDAPRDEWGSPASGALVPRPFRSTGEVRRTAAALDEGAALRGLASTLGLAAPPGATEATLATLYLTALANERRGLGFRPLPIPRDDLPAAARALTDVSDPRLSGAGAAGELLLVLARNRAAELAPIRAGETPPPDAITAVLVGPSSSRG